MLRPIRNKYYVFDYDKLSQLCRNPEDFTSSPYDLFLWFVLSSIKEGLLEPEEEEDYTVQNLWFLEVDKEDLERLVQDCIDDYSAACLNFVPIKFGGRRWTIRKPNTVDLTRLHEFFQFPEKDGKYILDPKGIMDLKHIIPPYEESRKKEAELNLAMCRKVEEMAEDDNNGWDKLTDMEAAMYCWFQFAKKRQDQRITKSDLEEWQKKYKDYHGLTLKEIHDCYTDIVISTNGGVPQFAYCFAHGKVDAWNKAHKQKSSVL